MTEMEGEGGASSQELVQIRLIQDAVPDVAVWPPNWETAGAEYLYRRDKLLVRGDRETEVLDAFDSRGVEITRDGYELEGVFRFDVTAPDDPEWRLPDEVDGIRRSREEDEDDVVPALSLDHLFYVCIHSCAAIEPVATYLHRAPIPRPSSGASGTGVKVLVIDNGLVEGAAQSHSWMHGVRGESDPAGQNGVIPQDGGHGTFTSGCVRVTAPGADVRVVNAARFLPPGSRSEEVGAAFDSDLALVLRAELQGDERPDVVVLNFAGTTQGDIAPPALAVVHANLIDGRQDLVVLSPAGNEGMALTTWPGAFPGVVSVGGLTDGAPLPDVEDPSRYQSGAGVVRASWSNHGDTVDVYAPGDLLVNAYAAGSYTPTWDGQLNAPAIYFTGMSVWSGTSFSTPLVAGMVAARKSASPQSSVRAAWDELAELAARQPAPDAGPALYPGQALD